MQVVIEDDQWAPPLQGPDLLVKLRILYLEKLLVHRVVCQEGHVVRGGCDDARGAQLHLDSLSLPLEVLQILLLERLVLEELVRLIKVGSDTGLDRVDDLLIDVAGENVGVHPLNELA